MKIDTSLIEGYSEMTADEKVSALEAMEYDDHSAEVERLKNTVSRANSEAAEWKRKHSALLSEEERKKEEASEELESLREQVETMKKEKTVATHRAQFLSLGYDEALAGETAQAMADGDMAKVFANQKKFLETHDKEYRAKLMGEGSRPPAGGSGDSQTQDYDKLISEAVDAGDFSTAAYYTRMKHEKQKK